MDTDEIETVLVAGASGDTGREVLGLLGPRVPTVRALTRSPEKRRSLRRDGADEVVVDDLLSPTDIDSALDGVDVVVSAVGSEIGAVLDSGPFVDGAGVQALVDAAVATGVEAFVMESAVGVGEEPASPLATAFDLVIGPIQAAKAETEAALRSSPLRHTILRPGVLTNGPRTDSVTVAKPGAKLYGTVSRADVARLLAAASVTDEAANATFEVVGRPSFPDREATVDWQLPATGGPADSVGIDVIGEE
jgi:uncharacterized protein YbjT (DUF2867 family)